MALWQKMMAELIGTFWLVFGGCGSAILAASVAGSVIQTDVSTTVNIGIGLVGVAMAFGLTVVTMAYAIGHISGCHLNPAVTVGLLVGGRFPAKDVIPYVAAQVLGAIGAAGMLHVIATGQASFAVDPTKAGAFATNGFGAMSPGGYPLISCLMLEVVLTFFFLFIILGATDGRAPAGFAPIPIGLGLTLIHLVGIPVTNLSVNPARSTGPALLVGGAPLGQLWLFWVAPIAGAALAGVVYKIISTKDDTVSA